MRDYEILDRLWSLLAEPERTESYRVLGAIALVVAAERSFLMEKLEGENMLPRLTSLS